jgi:ABC-type sugar transport system substrate-binding protein
MRLKGISVVLGGFLVLASTGAISAQSPSTAAVDLSGKSVLVVPYWLDQFNTANTSWISRLLTEQGVGKVDVINPDKSASRQLDIIETAIASGNYDAIAWQPIDETLAVSTIEKIQAAGLGQVVAFSSLKPGTDGLNFSGATVGWKDTYFDAGAAAATWLAEHPDLGAPKIAYSNIFPPEQKCDDLLASYVAGVQSVTPDGVEVVYNEGATSQAESNSKMTDFISRGIAFNIAAGCGTTFDMGGYEAIKAAGLAAATPGANGAADKLPVGVFVSSLDASPPELEALWAPDQSMMRSVMFGPKSAAEAVAKLVVDQLTGVTAPNASAEQVAALLTLGPDCETGRAAVLEQFAGVEGFSVPECAQ